MANHAPSDPVAVGAEQRVATPPDYGIDAPGVIRNLALAAVVGLGNWVAVSAGLWSGLIPLSRAPNRVVFDTVPMGVGIGVVSALLAIYMVWTSKFGKIREREQLLDHVRWSGTERVLDVGCGRGLMLIGAAQRATRGMAVGIDIWQAEDLSGNQPSATLENARREGVADRVEVQTADMRHLPFPDRSFDVVLSSAAIHNIYDRDGRAASIREIARVLAPGGSVVIDDIRHIGEYEVELRRSGLTDVRRSGSVTVGWLLAAITMGSLHPGSLVARRVS